MAADILSMEFFGNSVMSLVLFLVSIGAAFIIYKLIDLAVIARFKKFSEKSKNRFDDVIIEIIEKPLGMVAIIIGFSIGGIFLTLNPENGLLFDNILGVLVTIAIAWFVIKAIDAVLRKYVAPMTEATGSKIDDQLLPVISKVAKIVVIVLALIMIASNFGYDVTAVLAGFGIGGLAIAFAAQSTIADVFGGFSIFASKPFIIGDLIDYEGKILKAHQIGLRHSRFIDLDGRLVTVPNSKVANSLLTNISSEPTRKTLVNIGLTYDTPASKLKKAKEILQKIIDEEKGCDKNTIISFSEFKDSSLNLLFIYYINDKANFLLVRDSVNTKIKERFDKAKISFAFPSQTIYLQK